MVLIDDGYINVFYSSYKKIIKMLNIFSLFKVFYEDILSNILHTKLSDVLRQSLWLILIKFLNSQIFFRFLLLLFWRKIFFHEIKTTRYQESNKMR